jgi:hypothetical protein
LVSHTKEEHKLSIFQKRVLRIIFGTKKEKVTGGWKRLHNEKVNNFYASPNISRVIQ